MSKAKTLHEGKFINLIERDGWEYASRTGRHDVAIVVALNAAGKLILTEQYRIPVGAPCIELPAGLVGDIPGQEDEDLLAGANRELLEETGYRVPYTQLQLLCAGPVSAGMTSENVHFVWAGIAEKVGPGGGDETEDITVHEVALEDLDAWLDAQRARGAKVDPKVYTGVHFVPRMLQTVG